MGLGWEDAVGFPSIPWSSLGHPFPVGEKCPGRIRWSLPFASCLPPWLHVSWGRWGPPGLFTSIAQTGLLGNA